MHRLTSTNHRVVLPSTTDNFSQSLRWGDSADCRPNGLFFRPLLYRSSLSAASFPLCRHFVFLLPLYHARLFLLPLFRLSQASSSYDRHPLPRPSSFPKPMNQSYCRGTGQKHKGTGFGGGRDRHPFLINGRDRAGLARCRQDVVKNEQCPGDAFALVRSADQGGSHVLEDHRPCQPAGSTGSAAVKVLDPTSDGGGAKLILPAIIIKGPVGGTSFTSVMTSLAASAATYACVASVPWPKKNHAPPSSTSTVPIFRQT